MIKIDQEGTAKEREGPSQKEAEEVCGFHTRGTSSSRTRGTGFGPSRKLLGPAHRAAASTRNRIDDLTAKLEIVSSRSLHQGEKIQSLQQELLSVTEIQKKYEELQNENKELKEELLNLKNHMATNMVE